MDNLDDQLDQWIAEAPPLPVHLQAASDRITAKIDIYVWNWAAEHCAVQLSWDGDGDTCAISKETLRNIEDIMIVPIDWGVRYLQLGEWWFELTYIREWYAYVARRLDNPPTEE